MSILRQAESNTVDALRAQPSIDTLRQGTQALHSRLDGLLTASGSFDHLSGYRRYLIMMRSFYAEHAWLYRCDHPGLCGFFDESPMISILHDLQDLEVTAPFLRCARESAENEPAGAWGRAYVVLGSNLGAKEILARLGQSRIANPPLRFLNGCRTSATRWRAYMDALNTQAWTVSQEALMLRSARFGFNRAILIGQDIFEGAKRT
jgi:heme oxygenase